MPAHEQVAQLEEEIESLAERIEDCRKLSLLARAMIAGGLALLAVLVTGLAGASPALLVLAVAAALGGIVLLGSNRTSLERLRERLAACESRRAEIIARLDLRPVFPPGETREDRG
ncbi:hypothetical protein [Enterovirga aerilata]|uniref:Uncharacterized protein n=1 Tax=Enterovirga aerilata TaxID=2730920 RepID=A0A849I5V1_9HYPH|nr:hypothetical protein [Enterovirga sp. DB1703]NNM72758.1 hypothetical protein [Enterovirga sp. DB1703]